MKNRAEIVAEQITRSYGTTVALDHIVMEVEKGEIFGLIGPDGAGKSTLFRIFTTLLLPDSG
ncbi:MAG: ATP-binding cassette domain-containing protein, partial [Bacteroidales bacterium]|nr:ATP-binding cassette domain-containing protein [Bacteroidales bacterium]